MYTMLSSLACRRDKHDRYPYLLPNTVLAALALVALPLVLVFLEGPQNAEKVDIM